MPVELPIPDQQILDRHRESAAAVGATPGSEKRSSKKSKSKDNETPSNPPPAPRKSPRPRPKPANENLAAGVAAIELQPNAGPSSERKGKGASKNKEVKTLDIRNSV